MPQKYLIIPLLAGVIPQICDKVSSVGMLSGKVRYNIYLGRFVVGHFITVYGYNLTDELFYVYDSWVRGVYEKEIPIGNAVRSFTQFLLDWQGPVYYKLIQMDHVYMPVTYIGR
jgi:hypothetical protein